MSNPELDERRYQEFLLYERERTARLYGEKAVATTIFLNFVAPGLLEAPAPRTDTPEHDTGTTPIERPLGNIALFRQIARPESPAITEHTAYTGYAELPDAA